MGPPITVSKLDVAKRQLKTATLLWFMDEDPVSVHTLISAAHEITHTLFRRKGLSGLLFDSPVVKPEFQGEIAKRLKAAATFFKHAQKDPDATLNFNPDINRLLIITVAIGLSRMGENLDDIHWAFSAWVSIHHPNLVTDDRFTQAFNVGQLDQLRGLEKSEFLKSFLQSLAEMGLTSS